MSLLVDFVTREELRDFVAGRLEPERAREIADLSQRDWAVRSAVLELQDGTIRLDRRDPPTGDAN